MEKRRRNVPAGRGVIASASSADYELLDFGEGRKLERFGPIVVDRPCPVTEGSRKFHPKLWASAVGRFDKGICGGLWIPNFDKWMPADWHFGYDGLASFRLALDVSQSVQVGVFPEQRENWEWIARQVGRAKGLSRSHLPSGEDTIGALNKAPSPRPSPGGRGSGQALRVLNLFAYTGGSTLAAAAAGAEVVHVDAVRNSVERARHNAAISGLADRPIRWIVEDVVKFCRREVKRGNRYDAVILDPPTYGHGPKGELWKIEEYLLPLLELCGELTAENRIFVLATCHSPGIGPAELSAYLSEGIFGHCGQPPKAGELLLETADGRRLPSGVFARWPA